MCGSHNNGKCGVETSEWRKNAYFGQNLHLILLKYAHIIVDVTAIWFTITKLLKDYSIYAERDNTIY